MAFPLRPNLLLIMVDCLRADYFLSLRGNAGLPAIDSLRKLGTTYTDFHAVATTTTPSTATLLTGLYPISHGIRGHIGYRLQPEIQTLAGRLQAAGYRTVGRMTGPLGPETDIPRGFDDYRWRSPRETVFGRFGKQVWHEIDELQEGSRPWFYFLHVWALHMPLPAPWQDGLAFQFPGGTLLWKLQLLDNQVISPAWRAIQSRRRAAVRTPGNQGVRAAAGRWKRLGRQMMEMYKPAAYDRTLAALDRVLFRPLTDQTAFAQTLLAVTGDHGEYVDARQDRIGPEALLERRPNHSFHLYDYLTRVPLYLKGPHIPAGERRDRPGAHIDTVPTLLAGLGLDHERNDFDGVNLLEPTLPDRPLFFEAVGGGPLIPERYLRAVRAGAWKYIEAPGNPAHTGELYHLDENPRDQNNAVHHHPEIARQLQELLARHFEKDGNRPWDRISEAHGMSPDELRRVEARLRDLGYLE